ncbi:hypothetical protein RJ641_031600 [Dillenia turbinata]|uniref:BHLH domain-containing protein n=1 Tax=Dillenia turbinata TaxID=194707 RepID=A0AAN8VYH0_9MAGN
MVRKPKFADNLGLWVVEGFGEVVMVCQAASQTRFRALKHENGIAGTSTIIVRVIACFQPLQDCQAEYFRHLLKPVTILVLLGDCLAWMEKDSGAWPNQLTPNWQSPDLNLFNAPLRLGLQSTTSGYYSDMVGTDGNLPVLSVPDTHHMKAAQANEPPGWFYCLPRCRQAFIPIPNAILKKNPPLTGFGNPGEAVLPNADIGIARKRFVVFDQSGDQTTMIFSSALGTSIQQLATWRTKPSVAHDLIPEQGGASKDMFYHSQKDVFIDKSDENQGVDSESEMHEDTEELNALLYSDDENESNHDGDDEETSTGHSPSTMTAHEKLEGFEEEVASSARATKRRKLSDGNFVVPSLMDTATSAKTKRSLEYKDDAESSCGNVNNEGSHEIGSLSGNKRTRKERIRETVSILQSIIPGGKGKDAIVVLDKAISYLKFLKFKAESLGLKSLEV